MRSPGRPRTGDIAGMVKIGTKDQDRNYEYTRDGNGYAEGTG